MIEKALFDEIDMSETEGEDILVKNKRNPYLEKMQNLINLDD